MHFAVKSESPFNNLHRFIQKATTQTKTISQKYFLSNKTNLKDNIFYNVEIYTIKGNDPIGYQYDPHTSRIALNKNIDFYQNGIIMRQIPFNT